MAYTEGDMKEPRITTLHKADQVCIDPANHTRSELSAAIRTYLLHAIYAKNEGRMQSFRGWRDRAAFLRNFRYDGRPGHDYTGEST